MQNQPERELDIKMIVGIAVLIITLCIIFYSCIRFGCNGRVGTNEAAQESGQAENGPLNQSQSSGN